MIQGTSTDGVFDPSTSQVNSALYTGPSLYRYYVASAAWQQGVVNFVKANQTDKTKNPFYLLLECRLAWIVHTEWSIKTEKVILPPNEKNVMAAAVYDITLLAAYLRGIIAINLTEL